MKRSLFIATLLFAGSQLFGMLAISEAKISIELDRPVLPAERAESAFVRVMLEAPELPKTNSKRTPVNLCMVIDKSGSMHGDRIANAKKAMEQVVNHLSQEDILSVVTYDSSARVLIPAQNVENPEVILSKIRSIQAGGSTALFAGVSLGAAELRKSATDKHLSRMILLSDGQANVGPDSPAALGDLGLSLTKEKIGVSTVGLGTGYNEALMLTLAQKSGANAYFAENARDLERTFTSELGDALTTVIRGATITVECPGGTRPVRIIGFDGKVSGSTATITIDNLGSGQKKYALLEVAVPASAPDTSLTLANVKVNYELVEGGIKLEQRGSVAATFSKETEKVKEAIQIEVAQQAIEGLNNAAQIQMLQSNREGKYEEVNRFATENIQRNAVLVNDIYYGQADLKQAVEKEDDAVEKLKAEAAAPMPAAKAKLRSTDLFKKSTQQRAQ